MSTIDDNVIRKFDTGATRDTANNKLDFEGFLSPTVLDLFAEYMNKNRVQSDGSLRDSDNWQKGIPLPVYMKSAWRHFFHWWKLHRGLSCRDEKGNVVTMRDAIGGLLFNVMGYAHEWLKVQETAKRKIEEASMEIGIPDIDKPFPKFFYGRKTDVFPECIYVIAAEKTGRCFHTDGYGWTSVMNWQLDEFVGANLGGWGDFPVPMEITAAEAVRKGVPNRISDWPAALRVRLPSGLKTLVPEILVDQKDLVCESAINE
jgi:hypothetical protein